MQEGEALVAIGTESDLKIRAAREAFARFGVTAYILPVKASSGVSEQPIGLGEMYVGALTRLAEALEREGLAGYGIAIESGLVRQDDSWYDVVCGVAQKRGGRPQKSFSSYLPIPDWMVDIVIRDKTDLGEVVKRLASGGEKDAQRHLTDGAFKREQQIEQVLVCALAPVLCGERYAKR